MHKVRYKRYFYGVALFILVSIFLLWSWNTLAELFSGPRAQYKHVLAALMILITLRWSFLPSRLHRENAGRCLREN